ncbi:MAG: hypothetical protein R3E97_18490 [Candidatus Eisenbacteria bacterium]
MDVDDDAKTIQAVQNAMLRYNQGAEHFPLPFLESQDLDLLANGEVVVLTKKLPMPGDGEEDLRYRSIALRVVDEPREVVWLSALSPDLTEDGPVIEVPLSDPAKREYRVYQRITLPWPIKDRQWVIDVDVDVEASSRTGGLAWVQWWTLARDGEDAAREALEKGIVPGLGGDDFGSAVYLPANTGAWIVMELSDGRTLLAYELTLLMGGWIPDALGRRFARAQLEGLLDEVAEFAPERAETYDPSRRVIFDGWGNPVEPRRSARNR